MTGLPISRRLLAGLWLAVVAASAFSVASTYHSWWGSWGETARALEATTILSYPLTAGCAAWVLSAPHRRRFLWLLHGSARADFEIQFRATTWVALVGVAGFIPVAATACIVTVTDANYGHFPTFELVMIGAGFQLASGIGLLFARILRSFMAAPAAGIAVYVGVYLLDTGNPALENLSGFVIADPRERTYLAPEWWTLAIQSVFFFSLALLIIAAVSQWNGWLLPFAAVCLTVTPILLIGSTGLKSDQNAMAVTCESRDAYRLCMTRGRDHATDDVADTIDKLLALTGPFDDSKLTFAEESVNPSEIPPVPTSIGVVGFSLSSGVDGDAHRVDQDELIVALTNSLFQSQCGAFGSYDGSVAYVLQEWMFDEFSIPLDGSVSYEQMPINEGSIDWSPVSSFRSAWKRESASDHKAWFAAHGREVLSCDAPSGSD